MSKLLAGITLGTIAVAGAATGTVLAVQSSAHTNDVFSDHHNKSIEFGGATFDATETHRMYGLNRKNELIIGDKEIGQPVVNIFSNGQEGFSHGLPFDEAGVIDSFTFHPSRQPGEIINDEPFLKGDAVLDNKEISINLYTMRKEGDDFRDYPRQFPIQSSAQTDKSPAKETFFGNYILKFDSSTNKWSIKSKKTWQRDKSEWGKRWPGIENITSRQIPAFEEISTSDTILNNFGKRGYLQGLISDKSNTKTLMAVDVQRDRVWSTGFVQKGNDLYLSTVSNNATIEKEAIVSYVGQFEILDPSKTDKIMKAPVPNAYVIAKNMSLHDKIIIDNGDPANTNANKLYSAYLAGRPYTYIDFTMGNEEKVMLDLKGLNADFEKMHSEGIVKINQLEFSSLNIENTIGRTDISFSGISGRSENNPEISDSQTQSSDIHLTKNDYSKWREIAIGLAKKADPTFTSGWVRVNIPRSEGIIFNNGGTEFYPSTSNQGLVYVSAKPDGYVSIHVNKVSDNSPWSLNIDGGGGQKPSSYPNALHEVRWRDESSGADAGTYISESFWTINKANMIIDDNSDLTALFKRYKMPTGWVPYSNIPSYFKNTNFVWQNTTFKLDTTGSDGNWKQPIYFRPDGGDGLIVMSVKRVSDGARRYLATVNSAIDGWHLPADGEIYCTTKDDGTGFNAHSSIKWPISNSGITMHDDAYPFTTSALMRVGTNNNDNLSESSYFHAGKIIISGSNV